MTFGPAPATWPSPSASMGLYPAERVLVLEQHRPDRRRRPAPAEMLRSMRRAVTATAQIRGQRDGCSLNNARANGSRTDSSQAARREPQPTLSARRPGAIVALGAGLSQTSGVNSSLATTTDFAGSPHRSAPPPDVTRHRKSTPSARRRRVGSLAGRGARPHARRDHGRSRPEGARLSQAVGPSAPSRARRTRDCGF